MLYRLFKNADSQKSVKRVFTIITENEWSK